VTLCYRCLLVLLVLVLPAAAQDRAFTRAQHLRHGINASMWFAQSASDYSPARTNRFTDDADIALMAKIGFDSVRLSIDPVPLEGYPRNAQGLNADFLARLDHVVDTMLANGLAVQIDIHPEGPYKQKVKSDNDAVSRFAELWRRLAAHYAGRDPERIFFEVMNEPEVNDAYRWAGIQSRVAAAIRAVAPNNTLIVTGPNYGSLEDQLTLEPLADNNVLYTFHFYEPYEFTHQGAGWAVSWWGLTHDIPYPANEAVMPELLKEIPDAASRYELQHYWLNHWDAHRIRMEIDVAAAWGKAHNVPVICNEFGAFREHSDPASRMNWIHDVRTALEADGIPWTMWDYRGSFGVVWKKDGEPARVDPAVVEALGLKR
jgi:endoglucanase